MTFMGKGCIKIKDLARAFIQTKELFWAFSQIKNISLIKSRSWHKYSPNSMPWVFFQIKELARALIQINDIALCIRPNSDGGLKHLQASERGWLAHKQL